MVIHFFFEKLILCKIKLFFSVKGKQQHYEKTFAEGFLGKGEVTMLLLYIFSGDTLC